MPLNELLPIKPHATVNHSTYTFSMRMTFTMDLLTLSMLIPPKVCNELIKRYQQCFWHVLLIRVHSIYVGWKWISLPKWTWAFNMGKALLLCLKPCYQINIILLVIKAPPRQTLDTSHFKNMVASSQWHHLVSGWIVTRLLSSLCLPHLNLVWPHFKEPNSHLFPEKFPLISATNYVKGSWRASLHTSPSYSALEVWDSLLTHEIIATPTSKSITMLK